MVDIQLLTASRAVGDRLYAILYQAGFPCISQIRTLNDYISGSMLIVYHRNVIPELLHLLSHHNAEPDSRIMMLLDPDQYAMYIDRVRHLGIKALLMPAAPFAFVECVQECTAIF